MRRNKFKPTRRFERLEERRMMAADIVLDDGVIEVTGTDHNDVIVIETNPANTNQVLVTVTTNDDGDIETVQQAFARNQVTGIEVNADDGDDTVTNRTNILSELNGEEGDDILIGGTARDLIFGGEDDDTLQGGRGNDDLTGGEGNDIYRFSGSLLGSDVVFEEVGEDEDDDEDVDTLDFTGFTGGGINLDLSLTTARVINSGDLTLRLSSSTGIENVVGTAYEDTIRGNSRDNELRGEGAKDKIFGGEGTDTLLGGGGDDQLFGEGGFDRLEGGAGRDFLDGGLDGFADELVGNGDGDTFVLRKRRVNGPGPLEQSLVDYNSAIDYLIWGYY